MIPAPIHFADIDREAFVHPDVRAEIEAARERAARPHARAPWAPLIGLRHWLNRRRGVPQWQPAE